MRHTEVEFEMEMKTAALQRLTDREREIRGRVEDILDPHAVPRAQATQDEGEVETPEPLVNGNGGGAARVNGVEAVVKKSKKKAS